MLILLSPAKQLDFSETNETFDTTTPILLPRTEILSKTTARLKITDLKNLMGLSEDLATLNCERFQAFDVKSENGIQAAFAFNGEVYRGLDARNFSADDLNWAQSRLRILSGLYGVLRPLDRIQPYRLEMGTRLKTRKGANLYDFWDNDIAKTLKADLSDQAEQTIVNLASNEYSKAAKLNSIKAKTTTVDFKEEKDGQLRALMVFAKKARGMMARWIIENRIENSDQLTRFNVEGYRFDEAGSTPDKLLFTRPQPQKKS
jgi:cytoplasmic iron level regulating protein YaaA (DUF328/UPF0246 family)